MKTAKKTTKKAPVKAPKSIAKEAVRTARKAERKANNKATVAAMTPTKKPRTPKIIAKAEKMLGIAKSTATIIVEDEAKEQLSVEAAFGGATKPAAEPAARRARKPKAEDTDAPAVDPDAPRIECRLRVGELAVAVDASSLERTLGAGRWGAGRGLVDSWPDSAWVGLLVHLKLPADPLDRAAAEMPVKRLVQRLWYEAVKGGVPEERKQVFAERDAAAAAEYKPDFAKVEKTAETRAKAGVRMQAARGGPMTYEPTAALKDKKLALGGQAAILLAAFRDNGFKPMTVPEATAAMLKAGLKTTTKPERISSFYLSQWATKSGLLTRKNETTK